MASYNKVIIIGNITRDVELRYTPKGTAIASISVAVNRRWKDDAGQDKEEVTFVECTSFGKQAETLGQYMKKGSPIFVEGRLKQEQWEDKNGGGKRSKMVVIIEAFQFIGGKQDGSQAAPKNVGPTAAKSATVPKAPVAKEGSLEGGDGGGDDVPF